MDSVGKFRFNLIFESNLLLLLVKSDLLSFWSELEGGGRKSGGEMAMTGSGGEHFDLPG